MLFCSVYFSHICFCFNLCLFCCYCGFCALTLSGILRTRSSGGVAYTVGVGVLFKCAKGRGVGGSGYVTIVPFNLFRFIALVRAYINSVLLLLLLSVYDNS